VIFIHGCFWHGHEGCKAAALPETRKDWWSDKIEKNIINDQKSEEALRGLGWKIITIWTCNLKKSAATATLAHLLLSLT
jgi:DNA mismatch endonuclease (patch repair protein)